MATLTYPACDMPGLISVLPSGIDVEKEREADASLSYASFVAPWTRVTGTGSQARIDNPPRSLVPISSIPL
ncbi:Uncharacterised protein [Salmonella bongori]|nr:Uncharacterised protein [Salmonella bongori]